MTVDGLLLLFAQGRPGSWIDPLKNWAIAIAQPHP
jgi:hypothetical protein